MNPPSPREPPLPPALAELLDCAEVALVTVDARGWIRHFNQVAATLTGFTPAAAIGRPWTDSLAEEGAESALPGAIAAALRRPSEPTELRLSLRQPDGSLRRILWRCRRAPCATDPLVLLVGLDITALHLKEQSLARLAFLDPLTGLANRALLLERLQQELARNTRHGGGVALLMLDLDHFKDVNDVHGHPVGDALLAAVGERLRGCLRTCDTVARLGGDEFAVLKAPATAEGAARLARRLGASLATPIEIGDLRLMVGTSVGIALAPAESGHELLRRADLALYAAKSAGRGGWRFHDALMSAEVLARSARLEALDRALDEDGLDTVYLPTFATATGQLRGLEALVRWRDGDTPVPAGELITLALQSGRIGRLDRRVLTRALEDFQRWLAAGHVLRELSVNVSPRTLQEPDYAAWVISTLATYRVSPPRLVLELTEQALRSDPQVLANLQALRAHGVGLALDDFGDGASPIAALRRLPVQRVKVVRHLGQDGDPEADRLWHATVAFAAGLGLDVVAEGVETPEDLAGVSAASCPLVQGYLFGQPLAAAAVPELLLRGGTDLPELP